MVTKIQNHTQRRKARVFPESLDCLLVDSQRIGEIPVGIVDPHHAVLPLWYFSFRKNPAQLFHVDAHCDMNDVNSLERRVTPVRGVQRVLAYTKMALNEGNFICPAVWLKLLQSIYHFDPREERVDVYQEGKRRTLKVIDLDSTPKLGYFSNHYWGLHWEKIDRNANDFLDFPPHEKRTRDGTVRKINAYSTPLLLDIDLDAFECCSSPNERRVPKIIYQKRLEETFQLLRKLKRPSLVTIARSQTPERYVPRHRVDDIQQDVLDRLREVYAS